MNIGDRSWEARIGGGLVLACLAVPLACSGTVDDSGAGTGEPGSGDPGSSGTGTQIAPTPIDSAPCDAVTPLAQRVVRLTFGQVATTIQALLGPQSLAGVTLDDPRQRKFQALSAEGDLINTAVLQKTNTWADGAARSLADPARFAQVTGCASPTTDVCAQTFVKKFAEQAYRRPLSADDSASVIQLYSDEKGTGATIDEATRLAVQGILISPAALYRTEFGKPDGLSDYEVASELSYFVTNGPPDHDLLVAAQAMKLSTSDDVRAQVDRLLKSPAAVSNLNQVVMSYYQLGNLDAVVKDPMVYPDFTKGMISSMYTETQKFIEGTLWSGKVVDLLLSRNSNVDANLAKLYGVSAPGATDTNFVPVEFAEGQRVGILTQGSLLSMFANTNNTSVVHRGIYVNGNILCNPEPPPPPASVTAQVQMQKTDPNATERQKSDLRRTTSPCNGCHPNFDPFGLVLETYDGIGRYRKSYPGNVAIDTSVELPESAGGGTAKDVTEFVTKEASNGVFTRCMATNMLKYALGEGEATATDCSVKEIHVRFGNTDQTFASLVREIAASKALSVRGNGQ
jgi:hypothetical protein